MARTRRFFLRLLFAGAVAGAGYLGWVSAVGTPEAADLLPAGAGAVIELRGAGEMAQRLYRTRFAAAFAGSETRAWLERSDFVMALDALRAGIGRVAGFTPGRGIAFDVIGSDAAVGWYPAPLGSAAPLPWAAAGRLSARAWAAAGALRLARAAGFGAALVGSEQVHGTTLYSIPAGDGQPLHLFFAGRALVAGSDAALVREAARGAADGDGPMSRVPELRTVRDALPAGGELFVWVRDAGGAATGASADSAGGAPAGVVLRAGSMIEIDVAAVAAPAGPDAGAVQADAPLPGIALLERDPLLFLSSRDQAPPPLQALLAERQRSVAELRAGRPAGRTGATPGRGYAIVVTGIDAGSGLFPAPRGLVMIGMADAAAAAEALRRAFPPGARSTAIGSTPALATRESFPLAGEFELAGATVGRHLVFATDLSLVAAVSSGEAPQGASGRDVPEPSWQVRSLASVSMVKALPLLQRWAAPLSGLISARWPEAPQVAGDLGLLAAVRTVRVVAGSDARFRRASITLNVGDLP